MPLIRGFSEIDEEGKLSIPSNILRAAGLNLASSVGIKVVRIKGSSRWPYLIVYPVRSKSPKATAAPSVRTSNGVYHPQTSPRLSQFEVTMMESQGGIDENGKLILEEEILKETKFEPHYRAEIKLAGPKDEPWLVIRNRGPNRLTTLQEKVGRLGKSGRKEKRWQIQKWEY